MPKMNFEFMVVSHGQSYEKPARRLKVMRISEAGKWMAFEESEDVKMMV